MGNYLDEAAPLLPVHPGSMVQAPLDRNTSPDMQVFRAHFSLPFPGNDREEVSVLPTRPRDRNPERADGPPGRCLTHLRDLCDIANDCH